MIENRDLKRLLYFGLLFPTVTLNVWVLGGVLSYFQQLVTLLIVSAILAFLLDYVVRGLERVRVRLAEESAWLTIKGRCEGITRAEFEYAIPLDEARALLDLCLPSVIDKTRYRIPFCGHLWEIDIFHGDNEGLVIAEVELADASISPTLPPWVGLEVSSDSRYFNSCLAVMPYAQW